MLPRIMRRRNPSRSFDVVLHDSIRARFSGPARAGFDPRWPDRAPPIAEVHDWIGPQLHVAIAG